ncbi:MAG: hypothetical protein LBF84_00175 [Holosporales bacterium]|jgi:hypothetical protein|nr:hypothetical protein [Holosporales bacterium]
MTLKSVIVLCAVLLCAGFFILDFLRNYTRYDFLVKGEVCIALDRKEDAIKVIGVNGCVTVPLTKTDEQKMRDKIETELGEKMQAELSASMAKQHGMPSPQ